MDCRSGDTSLTPVSWRTLVLLLAWVVLVRGGVLLLRADQLHADPDAYRSLARTLSAYGVLGNVTASPDGLVTRPTAFRPPLYPMLLAAVGATTADNVAPIIGLHLLLGIATCWWTLLLGRAWRRPRAAVLAAALVGCDPILLNQSTQVMTETLATCLSTWSLWELAMATQSPRAGSACRAGIAGGLAALCRPTFLPWLILVAAAWLCGVGRQRPRRIGVVVVFAAGALIVLLPWGVRNAACFGRFTLTTTHGGYTLLLGNNASFYRHLREDAWHQPWQPQPFHDAWKNRSRSDRVDDPRWRLESTSGRPAAAETMLVPAAERREIVRDEFQDDAFAYQLAFTYIRAQPALFAYSCLARVGSLWKLVPQATAAQESPATRLLRHAIGLWYACLYAAAIYGLWTLVEASVRPSNQQDGVSAVGGHWSRSPWLWGLLLCATFTLVHAFYWSNMRMRAPLIPFLAVLAGAGLERARRVRG